MGRAAEHRAGGRGDDFGRYLGLLADIGQDFASTLDVGASLQAALARIAEYLDAEAASLFLLEEDDRALVCRGCIGPVDVSGLRVSPHAGIVGRAVQENRCQMVRDARLDPDFARGVDRDTGFRTRSLLCAPLSVKERCVGVVELLNKRGGDGLFDDADRNVLQVLASSAALAIINARLTASLIAQEKMRRELELAAEIQRGLLPRRPPEGFPVVGVSLPARGASGDFYDIVEHADGRIAFAIGDVSGKGIDAAVAMAKTAGLFHCLAKGPLAPGRLLAVLNGELCESGRRGMFVTMVAGVYHRGDGTVEFANAGHEPPLWRAPDGSYTSYPAMAPPLGIAPDLVGEAYPEQRLALAGGTFLAFTDGLTEGRLGVAGAPLGAEGVERWHEARRAMPLAARLSAMVDWLQEGGVRLRDDVTVIAIEERRGDVAP